jgi:hypothetical protein
MYISQLVGHNGGLPGFLTEVAFFPDDGIGFVIMINTMNATGLVDLSKQTVNAILGVQADGMDRYFLQFIFFLDLMLILSLNSAHTYHPNLGVLSSPIVQLLCFPLVM